MAVGQVQLACGLLLCRGQQSCKVDMPKYDLNTLYIDKLVFTFDL